jgi:thiamine biosynthesis protein ThiS
MDQYVQIQVNGKPRRAHLGETVAQLLHELAIRIDRVVVELNGEVLERPDVEQRPVREGDRVEIISFIGGGSQGMGDLSI